MRPGAAAPAALALSRSEHIIGVVLSETTNETTIATDRVMANSRKRRPTSPPIIRMGMKTAMSEMLMERTVKPTSCAPLSAASMRVEPFSICREMFSSTTIASSTTKPVATVRAMRVMLLREKPARAMTANVPRIETGTTIAGISVMRASPRNRNTTKVTRTTERSSDRSTSWRELRMVIERSMAADISMPLGIWACRSGIFALMRSTVSMMLAPGWRVMTSTIAVRPLSRPALRTSSTERLTVARSESRTGVVPR